MKRSSMPSRWCVRREESQDKRSRPTLANTLPNVWWRRSGPRAVRLCQLDRLPPAGDHPPMKLTLVLSAVALLSVTSFALAAPRDAAACARGYSPCLPIRSDLDCGQIADAKKPVRVTGADPYGLDADRDGLGCEVSGVGGGRQSPWGLTCASRRGRRRRERRRGTRSLSSAGRHARSRASGSGSATSSREPAPAV